LDFKDVPSLIQSIVLVLAGLFTLVHYTFKLSHNNTKFERMMEAMRIFPYLAAIVLTTVLLFVVTPIIGGASFSPPSVVLLTINIVAIFFGMAIWSKTKKIKAKWISFLIFLGYIILLVTNLLISWLYFESINLFTFAYELFAIISLLVPVINSIQNWMFSDIEKSKVTFLLIDQEEFEAEILSETKLGDYLVRKTNDPQFEYWVNRDQIKMIKVPTSRSSK